MLVVYNLSQQNPRDIKQCEDGEARPSTLYVGGAGIKGALVHLATTKENREGKW